MFHRSILVSRLEHSSEDKVKDNEEYVAEMEVV